jgi:transketolase
MIARREHDAMANAIRALAMDAVAAAKSGHSGLPMGAADIATVLFRDHIKFDAAHPSWPDRDRFVLSAGHGSMLIYALMHLFGVPGATIDEIRNFRQLGFKTAGHPEYGHFPGVETTTGPLGQGFGNAVGMAIAERNLAARFKGLVDHYTYVLAGDGCLMEGISQEAITLAGHLKLNRLVVFFDDNGISIDGPVSITDQTDQLKRFEASGWRVEAIDGHDPEAISAAILRSKKSDRPSLIAAKTIIGFGAPTKAGTNTAHGALTDPAEIAGAREKLGWPHAPFVIPPDVQKLWAAAGQRSSADRKAWEAKLASKPKLAAEFNRVMAGELSKGFAKAIRSVKAEAITKKPEIATRSASQLVLEAIQPVMPELISGSADLTGSNNTKAKAMPVLSASNYGGQFIHYGIREHGMAAAMNGLALHGGVIPAGGTFLVFSDYCRPSIRLSALMGIRVAYVMTHDSIGVGEDGPTHQPVEHVASLRAIPNLDVYRPCDLTETAEAWELTFSTKDRPSLLALTRQNLPQIRTDATARNLTALGAYEIAKADGKADVTLFASGSEVSLAIKARSLLLSEGILARVVSVPSFERFAAQPESYRKKVIGRTKVKIGIEAGIRQGWDAIIGSDGLFVGMDSFGASGPAGKVFAHFGITAEAVAAKAKAALKR